MLLNALKLARVMPTAPGFWRVALWARFSDCTGLKDVKPGASGPPRDSVSPQISQRGRGELHLFGANWPESGHM